MNPPGRVTDPVPGAKPLSRPRTHAVVAAFVLSSPPLTVGAVSELEKSPLVNFPLDRLEPPTGVLSTVDAVIAELLIDRPDALMLASVPPEIDGVLIAGLFSVQPFSVTPLAVPPLIVGPLMANPVALEFSRFTPESLVVMLCSLLDRRHP